MVIKKEYRVIFAGFIFFIGLIGFSEIVNGEKYPTNTQGTSKVTLRVLESSDDHLDEKVNGGNKDMGQGKEKNNNGNKENTGMKNLPQTGELAKPMFSLLGIVLIGVSAIAYKLRKKRLFDE